MARQINVSDGIQNDSSRPQTSHGGVQSKSVGKNRRK